MGFKIDIGNIGVIHPLDPKILDSKVPNVLINIVVSGIPIKNGHS